MSNFNIKAKNIIPYSITASIFIGIYIISRLFLKELYWFNWTSHSKYLYIWVVALILIHFEKYIISYSITFGNIGGIFLGQFVGDAIKAKNMLKIEPGMDVEQIYHLQHHPGFEIWACSILACLAIGTIFYKLKTHIKNEK